MHRAVLFCVAISVLPHVATGADFYTLKGHGGPIMDIAIHPEDNRIASASFDNSVGTWQDRAPEWLEDHRAAVNTVTFGPDGMISGGDDFRVLLWQEDAPTEIIQHKGKVIDVAVSPDGRYVASASWDGSIGLYDQQTTETTFLTGHKAGVNAVTFGRNGYLYSASIDGTLRLWSVPERSEVRQVLRHGFGINTIVLNEDDGWLAYGAVDGVTRVINLRDANSLADLSLERRPILAMAHNSTSHRLAVGDGQGYIMVVDTANWRITHDFRATRKGPIWALAMSTDGQSILAGGLDDVIYSWPVETLTAHEPMGDAQKSFLRDPAEMSNGERQFARKCSICHALTPGSARRAGPTLNGIFGRPAGSVDDYSYSRTLDTSDIIWNRETIDALFDIGPDHFIPGTKMPMQRITRAEDRKDLIEFLHQATASEGN